MRCRLTVGHLRCAQVTRQTYRFCHTVPFQIAKCREAVDITRAVPLLLAVYSFTASDRLAAQVAKAIATMLDSVDARASAVFKVTCVTHKRGLWLRCACVPSSKVCRNQCGILLF